MSKAMIFFADGFEEIEALSVVDVLRRGGVYTSMVSVGESRTVTGAHEIPVVTDQTLAEAHETTASFDMFVLPGGGPGTRRLQECKPLIRLLKRYAHNKYIAAICAAPSVLGIYDLLAGKKAVCYPGFEKQLTGAVIADETVVVDGKIITSKAAGTALEFALSLLEILEGSDKALEIQKQIFFKKP